VSWETLGRAERVTHHNHIQYLQILPTHQDDLGKTPPMCAESALAMLA
jgi:hypothetical protein